MISCPTKIVPEKGIWWCMAGTRSSPPSTPIQASLSLASHQSAFQQWPWTDFQKNNCKLNWPLWLLVSNVLKPYGWNGISIWKPKCKFFPLKKYFSGQSIVSWTRCSRTRYLAQLAPDDKIKSWLVQRHHSLVGNFEKSSCVWGKAQLARLTAHWSSSSTHKLSAGWCVVVRPMWPMWLVCLIGWLFLLFLVSVCLFVPTNIVLQHNQALIQYCRIFHTLSLL